MANKAPILSAHNLQNCRHTIQLSVVESHNPLRYALYSYSSTQNKTAVRLATSEDSDFDLKLDGADPSGVYLSVFQLLESEIYP